MSSRPALKEAILTNDLGMPHLVDIVANIFGVWLLIVFFPMETGEKDGGDSLVAMSSSFDCFGAICTPTYFICDV